MDKMDNKIIFSCWTWITAGLRILTDCSGSIPGDTYVPTGTEHTGVQSFPLR